MKNVPETDKKVIFSDTDTLSSFLWRDAFGYFLKLFRELGIEVVIPQIVVDELEYSERTRERLAKPIKNLERQGKLQIQEIMSGTNAYYTYLHLTEEEDMGNGEAAALSMVTHSEGKASVASNNLSDIGKYVRKNRIDLWTTARIISECEKKGILTEERAEKLWIKMKEDGLYLPSDNYSDYVEKITGEKQTKE